MYVIKFVVVLMSFFLTFVKCYTIHGYDSAIPLPHQEVFPYLPNAILRKLSDNETEIIRCPHGTHLEESTMSCQFIQRTVNKMKLGVFCPDPPNEGAVYPNPDDCKTFILCGSSGSFVQHCPANLLFNETNLTCVLPWDSNCCEFWEKNSDQLVQGTI